MLKTFNYFIQKLIQTNQEAFSDLVHKTETLSTHNSLFNWKHNHKHLTLVCARRSPKFDWKSLLVPKVWSHFDVCDGFVSLELNGKKQQKSQNQHFAFNPLISELFMFIGDVALENKTIELPNHDFNVFSEILDFHFYLKCTTNLVQSRVH